MVWTQKHNHTRHTQHMHRLPYYDSKIPELFVWLIKNVYKCEQFISYWSLSKIHAVDWIANKENSVDRNWRAVKLRAEFIAFKITSGILEILLSISFT